MLTLVSVTGPWAGLPVLNFNLVATPVTDLYEIRDISGLGPVNADVNTSPFGSLDGNFFTGARINQRNIVLTIGLRPNWDDWTPESLRESLDSYFMTGSNVKLVFETDEKPPVEISGYVESNEPNIFSKDPECQVSIICPEPDFVAVDPTVLFGANTHTSLPVDITYAGTRKTGVGVSLMRQTDPSPTEIDVHMSRGGTTYTFAVDTGLTIPAPQFLLYSVPGGKFVRNVTTDPLDVDINLLPKVHPAPENIWPMLEPGLNTFNIVTDNGTQNWTLTYYERYGSL